MRALPWRFADRTGECAAHRRHSSDLPRETAVSVQGWIPKRPRRAVDEEACGEADRRRHPFDRRVRGLAAANGFEVMCLLPPGEGGAKRRMREIGRANG